MGDRGIRAAAMYASGAFLIRKCAVGAHCSRAVRLGLVLGLVGQRLEQLTGRGRGEIVVLARGPLRREADDAVVVRLPEEIRDEVAAMGPVRSRVVRRLLDQPLRGLL